MVTVATVRSTAVVRLVGERVGAVEVRVRRVGERAVAGRTVSVPLAGPGDQGGRQEQVAVDVGVVGQHAGAGTERRVEHDPPERRGRTPSLCCSNAAAKRVISSAVEPHVEDGNWPVRVFDPRPLPDTSSPGRSWPGTGTAGRSGSRPGVSAACPGRRSRGTTTRPAPAGRRRLDPVVEVHIRDERRGGRGVVVRQPLADPFRWVIRFAHHSQPRDRRRRDDQRRSSATVNVSATPVGASLTGVMKVGDRTGCSPRPDRTPGRGSRRCQ